MATPRSHVLESMLTRRKHGTRRSTATTLRRWGVSARHRCWVPRSNLFDCALSTASAHPNDTAEQVRPCHPVHQVGVNGAVVATGRIRHDRIVSHATSFPERFWFIRFLRISLWPRGWSPRPQRNPRQRGRNARRPPANSFRVASARPPCRWSQGEGVPREHQTTHME